MRWDFHWTIRANAGAFSGPFSATKQTSAESALFAVIFILITHQIDLFLSIERDVPWRRRAKSYQSGRRTERDVSWHSMTAGAATRAHIGRKPAM